MSRNIFRVFGALLLIALIVAGGAFVYRAGVAQGISQAPEVAEAIQRAAEDGGQVPPMMYGHGYGYPSHRNFGHHFGFFPFGICGSIFFLFFFFGVLKMVFFRGFGHRHGHWGTGWKDGMFDEWHKRAHAEKTVDEKSDEGK